MFNPTTLKAGIKTTELWLSIIIIALTQLNVLQVGSDRQKGWITAALAIAYSISRGLAKLFPPKEEAASNNAFAISGPEAEVPGGSFPGSSGV